jgi:hypothetical protein
MHPDDRPTNVDEATSPEAIASPRPPKQPVSDNDPTRNISSREQVSRILMMALAVAALLVLAFATAALIF